MRICAVLLLLYTLCGCSASRPAFDPQHKYSPAELRSDYKVFRDVLEDTHPSLYWYTTKDSLDHYFDWGYQQLKDSMTEIRFRALLRYVIAHVHCGHTATRYSKQYSKYLDTSRVNIFPLSMKLLPDTTVINININRYDTVLKKGTVVTSINGIPIHELQDSLMQYISSDGYNETALRQTLSNTFVFGGWYRNVFGLGSSYMIGYLDKNGAEHYRRISLYNTVKDTLDKRVPLPTIKPTRRERIAISRYNDRYLEIDTALNTAYMAVNTFTGGSKLKPFFRHSFRLMRKRKISELVIDVRNNGGGNVSNSTRLTQYIIDKKFKLADSLYAIRKTSKYGRYMQRRIVVWPFMSIVTRKKEGKYHFGFFEHHYFKPIQKNHFDGNVYVIIGGNSFSATALFAASVKGQSNIQLIGEETGGSAYGNTAWYIPDVTLPNTGVRFRLPRFRLVMNAQAEKTGRGVQPDVLVQPTTQAIAKGIDVKVAYVKRLIAGKRNQANR
jgi:Peptidase family S41